jgi:two-component system, CitB family, response regulator DctR
MAMIKVLLIEDNPMVQEVNRGFIERISGFEIIDVASDGQEGKEKVRIHKPDLILQDIYMPNKDGLSLIAELRKESIDVDFIALTAANDSETIKQLIRYGVVDYIMKPFTFERLEKALLQYKEMVQKLRNIDRFSQEQLDKVRKLKTKERTGREFPKGIQAKTLNQILDFLSTQEEAYSAEEIGYHVGLARVTARRYLTYLESIESVEMEMTYGTIGRPIQLYRLKTGEGNLS